MSLLAALPDRGQATSPAAEDPSRPAAPYAVAGVFSRDASTEESRLVQTIRVTPDPLLARAGFVRVMNRLVRSMLIVPVAWVVVSCAAAEPAPAAGQMINPGDRIGDFLITTGVAQGVYYMCTLHCPVDESTMTESCDFPVGAKVNFGPGFVDDPATQTTLDEEWANQTYRMEIEGRLVNLQAFGSIDIAHPLVGKIRNWNVVIIADKPGIIAAHSTGEYGGTSFDYTASLTFTAP